jgi:hypothetical protein
VSSRLRPPKPRVISAVQPSSCGRAAAIPPPPASTRPVDPDVAPAHGDVIVSEGLGDEVLRGEDVAARKPASTTGLPRPEKTGVASIGKPPPAISGLAQQHA